MSEPEAPQPEIPEGELIRVRREKLAKIVELGYHAYPTKAHTDTTIESLIEQFSARSGEELESSPQKVKIAGRIMAVREFG